MGHCYYARDEFDRAIESVSSLLRDLFYTLADCFQYETASNRFSPDIMSQCSCVFVDPITQKPTRPIVHRDEDCAQYAQTVSSFSARLFLDLTECRHSI